MMKLYSKLLAAALVIVLAPFSQEVSAQRSGANSRVVEIWLMGPVPMYGPAYYFVATELLGPRGTTVATSRTFRLRPEEGLVEPNIAEAPERRQFVDTIIAELTGEGWQPAGMGRYWYSYRFRENHP